MKRLLANGNRRWIWSIGLTAVVALLLGLAVWGWAQWSGSRIQVRRQFGGFNDTQSVNGLGLLAGWLRAQGQQVSRSKLLTTQIEQYDLIIWTHVGQVPPAEEPIRVLDDWMSRGGRLVFLGHDHDATLAYWQRVYHTSAAGDRDLARWAYRHELAQIQAPESAPWESDWTDSSQRPEPYPTGSVTPWWQVAGGNSIRFGQPQSVAATGDPLEAADLEGEPLNPVAQAPSVPPAEPLAVQLNSPGPAPVRVRTWLQPQSPNAQVTTYLQLDDQRIPVQWSDRLPASYGASRRDLWVVSVPFFLTNFGLLQPEYARHRDEFLSNLAPYRRVLFLETGPGPVLMSSTPAERVDRPWAWMTQAPFPLFALHAVVLAIIFCFAKYPQFGRPKRVNFQPRNDFGQHLTEVGRLLRHAGSTDYARQKLEQYYQVLRRRPRTGQSDEDTPPRNAIDS